MPLILVLEMLKQGDHHFEASLGYIEGSKLSRLHDKTLRGSLCLLPKGQVGDSDTWRGDKL